MVRCLPAFLLAMMVATVAQADFVLTPFGEGFALLNKETGVISQCRRQEADETLICELTSDDRRALEEKIEILEEKIVSLSKDLAALKANDQSKPSKEQVAVTPAATTTPTSATKSASAEATVDVDQTTTATPSVDNASPSNAKTKQVVETSESRPFISQEQKNEIIAFGGTLMERLFKLVDDVKAKTAS